MIYDESDSNESQTIEALVPMVDLFAVLAIVFMIYASDEIAVNRMESVTKMQETVEILRKESEEKIQQLEEMVAENGVNALAKEADHTLEEIKQQRKKKAEELVLAFSEMLEAQQDQAAVEYEDLVTNFETRHKAALATELVSLDEKKRKQLEKERDQLSADIEIEKLKLKQEQEEAVEIAKQESVQALAEQKSELVEEKMAALATQQATLESQKEAALAQAQQEAMMVRGAALQEQSDRAMAQAQKELAQAEAEYAQELAATESALEAEKRQALAQAADLAAQKEQEFKRAEAEHARQLEVTESALEAENRQALAQAAQAEEDALAAQEAALAAQKAEELRRAGAEHAQELLAAGAKLDEDKRQALAEAAQAEKDALATQEAALAAEKEKALSETEQAFAKELDEQKELTAKAEEELTPFVKAAEAKQQIVDQLTENFKEFDTAAVEIDEKTGKVRLKFQNSYFVRDSHVLSEDMKDFLRVMIPKYARSIYENQGAAKQVESLKISGMTSPVHEGVYVDINDTSARTERARRYNMALSNKRALAMYNFIFDEDEMTDYQYRARLKKDMSIAALGFQNAQPVKAELIGKPADCLEYDCMKERATILQFQLLTDE